MFGYPLRPFRLPAVLTAVFTVTACSGLTQSDKPAINVWWLQPATVAAGAHNVAKPVPLFLDLAVVPGLDGDKVLALASDAQLKPYAGARWADDLPELADSLITRSLEATGRFAVLQHGRAGAAHPACELRLELKEFFADLEAGGRTRGVSIAVGGQYDCPAAEPLGLESRAYVGVDEERMSVIIAAFQRALDQVTLDIIRKIDIK